MNMFMKVAATATIALASVVAQAADAYPSKPIQLVIPYPPGGSADAIGRPLSAALARHMDANVILEYRAGAGGTIGTRHVARSKPDGYTLILALAAHSINPSLYPDLQYDAMKDFSPIGKVAELPLGIYLNADFPAKNLQELISYAKKKPGEITFSSAGNGNTTHLAAELFAHTAGIKIRHIPYKGGGAALKAVMGGDVSGMFDGSQTMNMVEGGRMRAIAFASKNRIASAPDVPTMEEAGLKDFIVSGWYGLLAPAGTSTDVINTLSKGLSAALEDPEFRKTVETMGYEVTPSTAEELGEHMSKEKKRWADVIAAVGAKVE
ncbi:tripartite tricarboxylate transporter substrate binding protein [Alcaligenaceae bacterium]|nr:tripartite tricarboxylate transporter substrate binding protein [Alcaligenaceae bacterium]